MHSDTLCWKSAGHTGEHIGYGYYGMKALIVRVCLFSGVEKWDDRKWWESEKVIG